MPRFGRGQTNIEWGLAGIAIYLRSDRKKRRRESGEDQTNENGRGLSIKTGATLLLANARSNSTRFCPWPVNRVV